MAHSIFPFFSNSAFEAYRTHSAQSHVTVVDGSVCSDDSHIAHFGMGSRGKSGRVSFNITFTCISILHVLANISPRPHGWGGGRCPTDSFLGYKLHATSYNFWQRGLIFCIAYFLTFLQKVTFLRFYVSFYVLRFYNLWLLSYDLVLKVMSRPI